MNIKTALVTGASGQIGSHLVELLLDKGYTVHGMIRRSSSFNTGRIDHIFNHPNLKLFFGDVSDYSSISSIVSEIKPEFFFNLCAQSHVRVSFDLPEYTNDIVGTGVFRCLEAIRKHSPDTKFLGMASSEMFGSTSPPQSEISAFHPRSPYAVSKVSSFYITQNYREAYDMFACNAVCFNTSGTRRGESFFERKVTRGLTRIKLGLQDSISLGNLNFSRDWQDARDVVRGLWAIVNHTEPDDFVIGSGISHTGQEFIELVAGKLGLDWTKHIKFDPKYLRPAEVDALRADPTKIKTVLGWKPEVSFEQMVDEMIAHDMKLAAQEKLIKESEKK